MSQMWKFVSPAGVLHVVTDAKKGFQHLVDMYPEQALRTAYLKNVAGITSKRSDEHKGWQLLSKVGWLQHVRTGAVTVVAGGPNRFLGAREQILRDMKLPADEQWFTSEDVLMRLISPNGKTSSGADLTENSGWKRVEEPVCVALLGHGDCLVGLAPDPDVTEAEMGQASSAEALPEEEMGEPPGEPPSSEPPGGTDDMMDVLMGAAMDELDCVECGANGHSDDAIFCYRCGHRMVQPPLKKARLESGSAPTSPDAHHSEAAGSSDACEMQLDPTNFQPMAEWNYATWRQGLDRPDAKAVVIDSDLLGRLEEAWVDISGARVRLAQCWCKCARGWRYRSHVRPDSSINLSCCAACATLSLSDSAVLRQGPRMTLRTAMALMNLMMTTRRPRRAARRRRRQRTRLRHARCTFAAQMRSGWAATFRAHSAESTSIMHAMRQPMRQPRTATGGQSSP